MAFFEKIRNGLRKTRNKIGDMFNSIFSSFREVDEEMLDELEEALILSDMGTEAAQDVIETLRRDVQLNKLREPEAVRARLTEILTELLRGEPEEDADERSTMGLKLTTKPAIILVVGVNGVGKTTSIGKLANLLANEGKHVMLAAGDTFRAAAAEQLSIWAERAGAEIVRHEEGSDPASVVYDAIQAAKARNCDVIICDTAGRLHNKSNLMRELEKISRVIDRELPGADRETLLVLDATTGQNALLQAKSFKESVSITGLVLAKLDGTAKGGIVIAIKRELDVPVRFVCVGEGIDDLLPFDPEEFAKALF
ncbi:MAG: signal recognition particle-docking protein FtsY [Oscillospiraceae bacterium]|nr:signal recognition particle-docking protein FtsY [Oscillospiraceae bacterium]